MIDCHNAGIPFHPSNSLRTSSDDLLVELLSLSKEADQSSLMKPAAPKPFKKRYLEASRDPSDKKSKEDRQSPRKNGLDLCGATLDQKKQYLSQQLSLSECRSDDQPLNLSLERIYVTSQQKIINHVIEMCMDSLVSSRSDICTRASLIDARIDQQSDSGLSSESPSGDSQAQACNVSPHSECRVSSTSSGTGSPPNSGAGEATIEVADSTEDFEIDSAGDGRPKRKLKRRRLKHVTKRKPVDQALVGVKNSTKRNVTKNSDSRYRNAKIPNVTRKSSLSKKKPSVGYSSRGASKTLS